MAMVVESTERVCQYCQLQMASHLTEEQAVTRKRQRFGEIAQFKTFSVQRRLAILISQICRRMLALAQ